GGAVEGRVAGITTDEFGAGGSETRIVQVGDSAGPSIELRAAALRSTALVILGTAGIPPMDVLRDALGRVLELAAKGVLHIAVEEWPLDRIASGWNRPASPRRLVFRP